MHEVIIHLRNKIVIKRGLDTPTPLSNLSYLQALICDCEQRFESVVEHVVVREKPAAVQPPSPLRFTNMCGKMDHVTHRPVFQPGVLPLTRPVKNAFGKFHGLYSKHCNLLTCTSKSSTLFRGGCSSKNIQTVLDHALNPDNICRITMHMLVATARLGHGICVDSSYLEQHVGSDPRWKCQVSIQHEDMSYVKSLRLSDFDKTWTDSLAVPAPQSLVVNISMHGSINFFTTMGGGVGFEEGVEHRFEPFLAEVLGVIERGC